MAYGMKNAANAEDFTDPVVFKKGVITEKNSKNLIKLEIKNTDPICLLFFLRMILNPTRISNVTPKLNPYVRKSESTAFLSTELSTK